MTDVTQAALRGGGVKFSHSVNSTMETVTVEMGVGVGVGVLSIYTLRMHRDKQ